MAWTDAASQRKRTTSTPSRRSRRPGAVWMHGSRAFAGHGSRGREIRADGQGSRSRTDLVREDPGRLCFNLLVRRVLFCRPSSQLDSDAIFVRLCRAALLVGGASLSLVLLRLGSSYAGVFRSLLNTVTLEDPPSSLSLRVKKEHDGADRTAAPRWRARF